MQIAVSFVKSSLDFTKTHMLEAYDVTACSEVNYVRRELGWILLGHDFDTQPAKSPLARM